MTHTTNSPNGDDSSQTNAPATKRSNPLKQITRRQALIGGALALLVVLAYFLRPIGVVRGPFMLFYLHPVLLVGPIVAALLAGPWALVNHKREQTHRRNVADNPRQAWPSRGPKRPIWWRRPAILAGTLATLVFVTGLGFSSAWTATNLADATRYSKLDIRTLQGGEVRVKPHEVAVNQLNNSLNSSTSQVTNMHVTIGQDGKMVWTAVRDPSGLIRSFTKKTEGIITSAASTSSPSVQVHGKSNSQDGPFRFGPGMKLTDNLKWQLYKRCLTCTVTETYAAQTPKGPVIVAPYLRYRSGFLARAPRFGGVYIAHPDGRIEDLSPKQAAASPLVRESGRMFPEQLAREIADSYKYHLGLANRMFTHEDGLEVADTEENKQPYLQKFKTLPNAQWVTTFKPRKTGSTGGVMLIDAVNGQARLWKAPQDVSYIGNAKALQLVKGETIDGITFASGAYRPIEPRQVFPRGRLSFLITIVPREATRSTRNVIVDAQTQQVTKVFTTDEAGDAELIAYLNGADTGSDYNSADGSTTPAGDEPSTSPAAPKGTDTVSTLQRLLIENREQQRSLKLQENDLKRLVEQAEKEASSK